VDEFYVYVLFSTDGIPRYVGKGKNARWKRRNRAYNPGLERLIREANGEPPIVIVRNGLLEEDAFSLEMALISAIGRENDGGPLVNMSAGGQGSSGRIQTDATRQLIREKLTGIKWSKGRCKNLSKARKGIPLGPMSCEHRLKISEAHKGKVMPEEQRKRLSATLTGRKTRPCQVETKRKIGAIHLGKPLSQDHRNKLSISHLGHVPSKEARLAMSDAQKRRWARSEGLRESDGRVRREIVV